MMIEFTLKEMREALHEAKESWKHCDYIDHWPAVLKCRADWEQTIRVIERAIAKKEEAERIEDDEPRQARHPVTLWQPGMGDTE
jgi:hypothetical protein